MSNIAKFPQREESAEMEQTIKRQVRRHRRIRLYPVILSVMIVITVLTIYFIYKNNKVFSSIKKTGEVIINGSSDTETLIFNGGILTYNKDGAKCMSTDGTVLWNTTYDMQNPMVSICKGTAAFADYGGNIIYIQKSSKESTEIDTSMPIRKIAVSERGLVAAVLEDSNVTWIYLYDFNKAVISYFRITMEKSGYPVDLDISENGELLEISFYYLDNGKITSRVAFYNFGAVGSNKTENYVSGFNYSDILVPVVRFLDEDSALAVSTERISFFFGSEIPVSCGELMVEDEILSVFSDMGYVAVVYANNTAEGSYRLEVYDDSANIKSKQIFDFDYTDISFGKNGYVIFGNKDIMYETYEGDCRYFGTYSENVRKVIPTGDSAKFYFVTDNSIDSVEME